MNPVKQVCSKYNMKNKIHVAFLQRTFEWTFIQVGPVTNCCSSSYVLALGKWPFLVEMGWKCKIQHTGCN